MYTNIFSNLFISMINDDLKETLTPHLLKSTRLHFLNSIFHLSMEKTVFFLAQVNSHIFSLSTPLSIYLQSSQINHLSVVRASGQHYPLTGVRVHHHLSSPYVFAYQWHQPSANVLLARNFFSLYPFAFFIWTDCRQLKGFYIVHYTSDGQLFCLNT